MTTFRIVVAGTGTEIGKTHLGVGIVRALSSRGEGIIGLKPIESGVDPSGAQGSDGAALAEHGTFHVKHPPPYLFPEPVSPHLGARSAGKVIDPGAVSAWVRRVESDFLKSCKGFTCPYVLIETAGGLFSPLGPGLDNLDLCQALLPDLIVLVAPDRLGVLHDVTACLLAARSRGKPFSPFVVLQPPVQPDASTGYNLGELISLGLIKLGAMMPRASPVDPAYQKALLPLINHILVEHVSRETLPRIKRS